MFICGPPSSCVGRLVRVDPDRDRHEVPPVSTSRRWALDRALLIKTGDRSSEHTATRFSPADPSFDNQPDQQALRESTHQNQDACWRPDCLMMAGSCSATRFLSGLAPGQGRRGGYRTVTQRRTGAPIVRGARSRDSAAPDVRIELCCAVPGPAGQVHSQGRRVRESQCFQRSNR